MDAASQARAPLSLRLPATRTSVEVARLAALEFLEPYRLSARDVFNFELVLEELLINVALHAYPPNTEGIVDLTVDAGPGHVRLHLEDEGVAFDPALAPIKPRPTSLDDATPGGLGLQLVRQHARDVAYARRDGRNVTTVTIDRQRADAR